MDDGSVGYAIRGESKQDIRTKLLFCTTGVVLRRLGSGEKLEDVTHVIVDEVIDFFTRWPARVLIWLAGP